MIIATANPFDLAKGRERHDVAGPLVDVCLCSFCNTHRNEASTKRYWKMYLDYVAILEAAKYK